MPDICAVILDQHNQFRRRFAELDDLRREPAEHLERLWLWLGDVLDRHAAAEERCFYPELLACGARGADETRDAIGDHDDIRDAVRDAGREPVGSKRWWNAVIQARRANSDHMAEEERGALADFRTHVDTARRAELGARFLVEIRDIADHVDIHADVDPNSYIEAHSVS
ncbi:MAG TPA: hemerythrin domain-containing protein [Acidimicrobiales bacterium]